MTKEIAKYLYLIIICLGLSDLLNCQIFATVIGIKFNPKASNGDKKNVMMVIAVVGRPIPIIPFTTPAIKKVKATIMAISFGLFIMSNASTF